MGRMSVLGRYPYSVNSRHPILTLLYRGRVALAVSILRFTALGGLLSYRASPMLEVNEDPQRPSRYISRYK